MNNDVTCHLCQSHAKQTVNVVYNSKSSIHMAYIVIGCK